MLRILWDTRGYFFWLLAVSAFVLILERLWPRRREQRVLRAGFAQDLFWLFFNGHYAGILAAKLGAFAFAWAAPFLDRIREAHLLDGAPLWFQFLAFLLLKDFLDWCIHNALHRSPRLWEFHKLHHSIEEMDWIGNFRFHWMEVVVYQGLTYLPLTLLGADGRVVLWVAVFSTLVGHLNHANLDIGWGPLGRVFNSPAMHVWHHDAQWPADRPKGLNFGVVFSCWDWLFGTAWMPDASPAARLPDRLGFPGLDRFPRGLFSRLVYPLSRRWSGRRRRRGPGDTV